jgi:hypothetical protein
MVSRTTPTTMMIEVAANETLTSKIPVKNIGSIATIASAIAPIKITLLRIEVR